MVRELSIIIPALNEEAYLPALLDSIVKQHFDGALQVIVVDGGSSDSTVEAAESFRPDIADLVVMRSERGVGLQRNRGASEAKYRCLLFLDADVVLPPGVISGLMRQVDDSSPFVGAVVHRTPRMSVSDRLALSLTYSLFAIAFAARLPVTNGDFLLTTRENHHRIGGFREGAILGEDTDYGIRSVRGGARFRFFRGVQIIASDRRVKEMGRVRLVALWSKVFIRVWRHGPVYPGEGIEYPFGHYGRAANALSR